MVKQQGKDYWSLSQSILSSQKQPLIFKVINWSCFFQNFMQMESCGMQYLLSGYFARYIVWRFIHVTARIRSEHLFISKQQYILFLIPLVSQGSFPADTSCPVRLPTNFHLLIVYFQLFRNLQIIISDMNLFTMHFPGGPPSLSTKFQ